MPDVLRLPRLVESDPDAARRIAELVDRGAPLWAGGEQRVPTVALDAPLLAALQSARSAGRIVRGLEAATTRLAGEAHGQRLADERSAAARGARVSRLLLISADGSDRFYRDVDVLLRRHAPRVLALRLDADAHQLGEALFGRERLARLVLLEHKDAVGAALLAIAASQGRSPGEPVQDGSSRAR